MAAFEQPRAGGQVYLAVPGDASGKITTGSAARNAGKTAEALKWAASIAGGILVGAAAAFLVGGLLGVHETVDGTAHVVGTSVAEPAPAGNR